MTTTDNALSGFSGAVFLDANYNTYSGSGYSNIWPSFDANWSFYASKLKDQMPILEAPDQDGVLKLPSFSAPFESDHGGVLPSNQQNVHLTGSKDLTMTANGLDDLIVANGGNDTLIAGAGKSTLIGGKGHTTFITGSGDSTIIGGTGSTEIQYTAGSGNLTVKHTGAADSIYFAAVTSATDIQARVTTDSDGTSIYTLTLATGQTIALHGSAQPLERLTFSDGSSTTLSKLLLETDEQSVSGTSSESVILASNIIKMTLTGNSSITARGNGLNNIIIANDAGDTLIAGSGNSTLIAGKGQDTLIGTLGQIHGGTTTFVHGNDAGHTIIKASGNNDILQFGPGITATTVYKIISQNADGIVASYVTNSGESVDIQGNQYGMYGVGYLQFSDGNKVRIYDIDTAIRADGALRISHTESGELDVSMLSEWGSNIYLGSADARVSGSSGSDQFYAGDGHATFISNGGFDQFFSGRGDAEFIGGTGELTYVITEESGDVLITASDRSDLLMFDGDVSAENVYARAILQSNGTVTYRINVPGRGTVTLDPVNGNLLSSIRFGEYGEFTSLSKLLLASDPNASQSSDSASFVPKGVVKLTLTGSQSLTVQGNELDNVIIANEGDDTLIAGTGWTTLVAGHGSDTLIGNHGHTTYALSADNGNTIVLNSTRDDHITFGQGVNASDLQTIESLSTDGKKIVTIITETGLSIELRPDAYGDVVQNITFADGTQSDVASLQKIVASDAPINVQRELNGLYSVTAIPGFAATIQAGALDMTIYANDSGDTLVAGSGTDTLVTGKGNDILVGAGGLIEHEKTTFLYSSGSGNTEIRNSTSIDTLKLYDGITQENMQKVSSYDDLGNQVDTLIINGQTNITIQHGYSGSNVVNVIDFSDGSSTTLSALNSSIEATGKISMITNPDSSLAIGLMNSDGEQIAIHTGNALVNGSEGSDIFIGGAGNTTFYGGERDTFRSGTGSSIFVGGEGANYEISLGSGDVAINATGNYSTLLLDQEIQIDNLSGHSVYLPNGEVTYIIDIQNQGSIALSKTDSGKLPDIAVVADDGSWDYSLTLSKLLVATDPGATMSSDHDLLVPLGVVEVNLTATSGITVMGNNLDDIIIAHEGNNTLIAGSGYITLVAGHGQDTLIGNGGDTVFQYALGSGIATILQSSNGDTIALGQGITFEDLSATIIHAEDGSEIVDIFVSSHSSILIQPDDLGQMVNDLLLSDGSYVSLTDLLSEENIVPLVGQAPELAHI